MLQAVALVREAVSPASRHASITRRFPRLSIQLLQCTTLRHRPRVILEAACFPRRPPQVQRACQSMPRRKSLGARCHRQPIRVCFRNVISSALRPNVATYVLHFNRRDASYPAPLLVSLRTISAEPIALPHEVVPKFSLGIETPTERINAPLWCLHQLDFDYWIPRMSTLP